MGEGSAVSGNEFHMVQRSSDNLQSSINKLFLLHHHCQLGIGHRRQGLQKRKESNGHDQVGGSKSQENPFKLSNLGSWERVEGEHPVGDKNGWEFAARFSNEQLLVKSNYNEHLKKHVYKFQRDKIYLYRLTPMSNKLLIFFTNSRSHSNKNDFERPKFEIPGGWNQESGFLWAEAETRRSKEENISASGQVKCWITGYQWRYAFVLTMWGWDWSHYQFLEFYPVTSGTYFHSFLFLGCTIYWYNFVLFWIARLLYRRFWKVGGYSICNKSMHG
jgi:hypothetical protein